MAKLTDLPPEIHVEIVHHLIPETVTYLKTRGQTHKAAHQDVQVLASLSQYWVDIGTTVAKQRLGTARAELETAEREDGATPIGDPNWYVKYSVWSRCKKAVSILEMLEVLLYEVDEKETNNKGQNQVDSKPGTGKNEIA